MLPRSVIALLYFSLEHVCPKGRTARCEHSGYFGGETASLHGAIRRAIRLAIRRAIRRAPFARHLRVLDSFAPHRSRRPATSDQTNAFSFPRSSSDCFPKWSNNEVDVLDGRLALRLEHD